VDAQESRDSSHLIHTGVEGGSGDR